MRHITRPTEAVPVRLYAKRLHGRRYGAIKALAQRMGTYDQYVQRWARDGWVVINDRLYAPRRAVK